MMTLAVFIPGHSPRDQARARFRYLRERETATCGTITRRAVLLAVAGEFGREIADLRGERRLQRLVVPRAAFALIASRRLHSSRLQIGLTLGGRDHTTALNLVVKGERMEAADAGFAARVARIEAELWPKEETRSCR